MSWLLPCSLGSSSACFMTNVCQLYNCHLYNCHRDRASIRLSICATVIVRKVARTRLVFCTTVIVTQGDDTFGHVYSRDRGAPAGSCSTMKGWGWGGGGVEGGTTENCTEEVLAERGVFSVPSYFRRSCEGPLSSLHRATLGAGTVSLIPS